MPAGETVSYGALARGIGRPDAARAVGAACGANPIWLVVPCHRAIGSDGRLVGYAGGLQRKGWLLGHEQATQGLPPGAVDPPRPPEFRILSLLSPAGCRLDAENHPRGVRACAFASGGLGARFARPGPTTLRYGGNTACVEVRAADGTLVVLDCGTGAYALGRELANGRSGPVRGHLLIGHTHWDHIQGFPFFEPLFTPEHRWSVYAPGRSSRQLEETLAGQMAYAYSPINLEALRARVEFQDLAEGSLQLGGIHVQTQYLNHPALTLGYRLEADGATLVYATDHEPHSLHPLAPLLEPSRSTTRIAGTRAFSPERIS